MPLPPLAASERRLARFAEVSSWICAPVGLATALVPQLELRGLMLGGHAPTPISTRLFAALAGAGLIGIAAALRRTALSPREHRHGFSPLLWTLGTAAISLGIAWRRGDVMGIGSGPLGVLALACAALYSVLGLVYFRAAPGVNLGGPVAAPAEAAPKAVQLGVRVAPAPAPLPVEPQAAAGASRG